MDGKNLALQGPPGTGKSQTITNIIGAALAENKRVLFLADKSAARDVVYKKLKDAGLGDFCLHITSTAMNKVQLIEDIKKRINLKTNKISKKDIDFDISKEEKIKSELIEYKKLMTTAIGQSEKDLYEIGGLKAKYKQYEKKIFNEIFEDNKNKLFQSTSTTTILKAHQQQIHFMHINNKQNILHLNNKLYPFI